MKTYSSRILPPVTKHPPAGGAVPIAQVAHGLNNTLTVITGFSELLLSVLSECDPHRRYVEEIQRAGQHAAELTRQLLTCAGTPSPPSAKAPRASRTLRELAHQHHGCETILLVEDDEAVRDALGHELILLGYTVLEAADGPEALRVASAQPDRLIDLLLTDVVMPEMDGFTLAARLREKQPRLKVLFSSGYERDVMLRQSSRPSSDGFLPKPYNAAALMRTIGEVLGEGPPAGPMTTECASHPVLSPPD
ncbi:MAG: response regulator [Verrucomicrobiota bacterium]|jgi:CheY-like chemotaxis protein